VPRITIIYLNFGDIMDDDEEEEEDAALDAIMLAQRCNLTEQEKNLLLESLSPLNTCIEVPYVNRLAVTNFDINTMVRFFQLNYMLFFFLLCCVHAYIVVALLV
jgi:hypothetical protein